MNLSASLKKVSARVQEIYGDAVSLSGQHGELTIEVERERLRELCLFLRDDADCRLEQLVDVCGVDYLDYRKEAEGGATRQGPRFATVYHLLSVSLNHRVRVRTFVDEELMMVDSVVDIWNSASWYEREAFDLYGIVFDGHPDLRRILTDYGFVGHPFRKDFPISGHVEMRYDERKKRVVYEPVSIEPRQLTPRVIREEGYGGRDS